ncbi:hypothetical protein GHV25_09060 [Proteus mirabilis]|uniref:hypothetical protein n=1 Tax=Proteus TaxID=583 RepID=UPI000C7B2BE2|nr:MULTISPECIES: hypothetical protein [Proteus]MBG2976120.1 hypothetical protein [Proteus mirabilis]MBG3094007.1 hypothetical protein [Proteus mirabilis]MBI6404700.1 hypothetical protein [Proteus sp. PR00208]PLB11141.1 hypothetical protein CYK02_03800 [Proteus mirabilis]HEJ9481253.1 hypothetical protein [Proteus mirabilis]
MKNISNSFVIKKKNTGAFFNDYNLKGYMKLFNNIKDIKNTPLKDISCGCNGKKVSVNIAEISRELLSKILKLYTPTKISSYKINTENREKSIKLLNKAYGKIDGYISDWWENEIKIFPSSRINREIDNLYHDEKFIMNKETKKILFFLISKKFNLDLDNNAAQSTIIQHLQDIPEVVKAIDELGIANDSYSKYETYCLIAEYIYNILSENKVDFSKIKDAVKEIAERNLVTPEDKLASPYSTRTLIFL